MTENLEKDLARALRSRAAAHARAMNAEARVAVLESAMADVWRWTNDGHPHLELLLPILRRADREYELASVLDLIKLGGI